MVLELNSKQNIIVSDVVTTTSSINTKNIIEEPIINGGEVLAPEDTLSTNNAEQTETSEKTKRTRKELINALAPFFEKNGISALNVSKLNYIDLLCDVSGLSKEEVLNADNSVITNAIEKVQAAINALKEDGIKPNSINIRKYAKLLNGEIPQGWDSVDSFRAKQKRNHESLKERIERAIGIDISKSNKEEVAKALETYFAKFFNEKEQLKLKNAKTAEEKEQIKESIRNLQITDFTKLVFNSNKEDNKLFIDAIAHLAKNKRGEGLFEVLNSFENDEARTEFSNNNLTQEQVEKIVTTNDCFGENANEESAKIVSIALEYQDAKHVKAFHEAGKKEAEKFYSKETLAKLEGIHPESIKEIQKKLSTVTLKGVIELKLQKGEKITAHEQELLNTEVEITSEEEEILEIYNKDKYYRGENAGKIIGVANNKVINETEKTELINTVHSDAYQISEKAGKDFYRDVLTEVVKEADNLPEEAKALIKNTIGENFEKIAHDIENGTKTELSKPEIKSEVVENLKNDTKKEETTKGSFGYEQKEAPKSLKTPTLKIETNDKNDKTESPIIKGATIEDYYQANSGAKGFANIQKEFGTTEAIKYTLNKCSQDASAVLSAVKSFKILDASQQINTIKGLYSGLELALNNAKKGALEKLQNTNLSSFGATQEAKKIAEERLA